MKRGAAAVVQTAAASTGHAERRAAAPIPATRPEMSGRSFLANSSLHAKARKCYTARMDDKTENGGILRVKYSPSRSVELMDFVKSCMALASEYNDFAKSRGAADCRLFIKEVRHGSIELDLVSFETVVGAVQQVLPIAEAANVFVDFLGHVRMTWKWLVSGAHEKPEKPFGSKTLSNISDFVNPIAKDSGATVMLNIVNVEGDVNAPISFGTQEANVAQNVIRRIGQELGSPNVRRVEQTVLKWHQTRNDVRTTAGNKAIIESISPEPVRTVFSDRNLQTLLLSVNENIYKCLWLVDVTAEFSDGVPRLYKIETIEKLDDISE